MINKMVLLVLAAVLATMIVPGPVAAQPCFIAVTAANDGWFDGTAVRFQKAMEQALIARNSRVAMRDAWEISEIWGALSTGQMTARPLNGLCKVIRIGFSIVERQNSSSQWSFPNLGTFTQRTVVTVELDAKLITVGPEREILFSRTETVRAEESAANWLSITVGGVHYSQQRSSQAQVRFQVLEFVARWLVEQMGSKI